MPVPPVSTRDVERTDIRGASSGDGVPDPHGPAGGGRRNGRGRTSRVPNPLAVARDERRAIAASSPVRIPIKWHASRVEHDTPNGMKALVIVAGGLHLGYLGATATNGSKLRCSTAWRPRGSSSISITPIGRMSPECAVPAARAVIHFRRWRRTRQGACQPGGPPPGVARERCRRCILVAGAGP